jgi:hypothetical protein
MLSVANNHLMMSVIMLNVVVLSVVLLSVVTASDSTLEEGLFLKSLFKIWRGSTGTRAIFILILLIRPIL